MPCKSKDGNMIVHLVHIIWKSKTRQKINPVVLQKSKLLLNKYGLANCRKMLK